MKLRVLLYIPVIILFCSCEGYKILNGVVISNKTHKPIANARIYVLNGMKQVTRTNTDGRFSISSGFTSLFLGGPKFIFEVSKEGYKTKLVKKKGITEVVTLEEEE